MTSTAAPSTGPRFDPSDPHNSISVVIPLYNGAKYIAETLDSVLAQTVPPSEVIVVNDGSTDNGASVVQNYGNRVNLITIPNGGAAAARNLGASRATGNWIALCDGDDLWLPAKLEKQLELANECTDVHCVITDFTPITDGVLAAHSHHSYAPAGFWTPEPHRAGFVVRQPIAGKLTTFQPSITSVVLVKRAFYLDVGGFDVQATNWADDTCLHFRCLSTVPFGVVPEVLMHYRQRPGSLSADALKQLRDSVTAWEHIISTYPQAQPHRAELLQGLEAMRKEVAENTRYRRRQKIKRLLGLKTQL